LFTIVTAEDWTNTTTAEHGEGGHGELGSGKSHGSSDRGEGAADGGEREVDLSMDSRHSSMGKKKSREALRVVRGAGHARLGTSPDLLDCLIA
jgi:hypothetical protein